MKKLVTFIVVLLALGGGAYYYFVYSKPPEKPTILTAAVSRGEIQQVVQATGTLEALRTVNVGSQVSGTVMDLHGVDFNTIVHAGQVIASIDPTLLEQQVQISQANIDQRQTDIDSQGVQLQNDELNLKRTQEQFDAKLVSQQALEAADLQVKTRKASIESSKKQLVSAQAQLAQAQLNVNYCTIKSPIDGVVVARNVDVGQTVQSSMTVASFFVIATDLTNLKLTAGVDEADIGNVRPNMPVHFTVDSYPNTTFEGTVNAVRLNATSTQNVVTYPVWIDVKNADLRLRPSMTAQVKIIIDTVENALRVPNQATRFRPNADIYVALGLEPPAAGNGRNAAGRGNGPAAGASTDPSTEGQPNAAPAASAPAATPGTPSTTAAPATTPKPGEALTQPGKPGAPQMAQNNAGGQNGQNRQGRQPGQNGQNGQNGQGGNRTGGRNGRGFGFGGQTNMTPEELAAMRQRFGNGGGRRGQQPAANASTGPTIPITQRNADKIDELYMPMPKKTSRGSVWTWDPTNKALKSTQLTLGLTDGQFTEVVSGDVQVGEELVTSIIVPQTKTATPNGQNPLMGPQRGGPGGGGNPGGGGRGPGGGGGGGGRGGN